MSDSAASIPPSSDAPSRIPDGATNEHSTTTTTTTTLDAAATENNQTPSASPSTGGASSKPAPQRIVRLAPQIPQDLLDNPELAKAIAILPSNYNFEIYKTIWRLRESKAKMVALQFPEGLLMYSCIISDILAQFAGVQTVIMGDVTYGACCVDDFTARALGCDFMVHYGHSCLVPIDVSTIQMLYVFVDIAIDTAHLVRSLQANFQPNAKLILAGTIQFATAIANVAQELKSHFSEMFVPQARPLSKGEVLGCTSPKFGEYDAVIFLADGRFHLESMMIHNPHIDAFYKYDPYNKKLTREVYAYEQMYALRQTAITQAKRAKKWGIILGTLGRQGNMNIVTQLEAKLKQKNLPYIIVLLSEIFPDKLSRFPQVEAWIQVACPRLSIDWGYAFQRPLLSSYEAHVALDEIEWQQVYPMDYYSDAGGSWSNYHAWTKQSIGGAGEKKSVNPIKARKEKKAREAAEKAAAAAAAAAANGTVAPEVVQSTGKIEIAYSDE